MQSAGSSGPGQAAARGTWSLALLLCLGGCADVDVRRIPLEQHPNFGGASTAARAERETQMNRDWQNRPLTELLAAYGKPQMVMNIPGGGMPPSFAVVYGTDPDSGCIDAFAVSSKGEPVVRIYHCR
ncbi:hypothetical protein GCM10028796_55490 [Ramlibacter monticola]|uniref:Uncharacterized protein n=1 Tax=Ramlibacter monticola TaxID=1926872 RepID=A0A936Z7Z6_9BURK|nr:hypothetical protein [Ramlibacter monticola]MBL0394934.1 hypothetical protein [Ramlibacter monticola]